MPSEAPVSSHTLFTPSDTSEKCVPTPSPSHHFLPLMRVSPFSLSIPWVTQHEPSTKPKFTLGDDLESDPSSSPITASPGLIPDDFTSASSSISDGVMASNHPPRRRWTLAMAMTDDAMTDEALVEVLERIRAQRETSDTEDTTAVWDVNQDAWNWDLQWEGNSEEKNRDRHKSDNIPHILSLPSFPLQLSLSAPSSPKTAMRWQTARQALLTCRELVRTERHYLSSLNVLIALETATTPPPLMIHHANQLASISERYLTRMEADPSASGVAVAFLDLEEAVEGAFIGWCEVIGGWFEGNEVAATGSERRLSKGRSEEDIPILGSGSTCTRNNSPRRAVSTWKRSVPTMTSMGMGASSALSSPQGPASLTPSFSSSFLSWRKDRDRSTHNPNVNGNTIKKPLVRDLAILPTQRVLRYVLLYRGMSCPFCKPPVSYNRDRSAGTYPSLLSVLRLGGTSRRGCHSYS
ncbi:hypothetical protein AX15_000687 [Amanita polypyramis BW_CC]|nr:hypothetical protein AX15_000687 [Amanita polypyramis BW_CC]